MYLADSPLWDMPKLKTHVFIGYVNVHVETEPPSLVVIYVLVALFHVVVLEVVKRYMQIILFVEKNYYGYLQENQRNTHEDIEKRIERNLEPLLDPVVV
jgi:hypothetical protein